MSEFKASGFRDEFGNAGPDLVGITTFTSPHYFVPPSGSTAERPSSPPPGMLRFNTDIGRLEVWRGDHWATILGESPNLGDQNNTNSTGGTGTRAVFCRGDSNGPTVNRNIIDYITISTLGNAQDFGDDITTDRQAGALASSTRALIAGRSSVSTAISFITFASTGDATSFTGTLLSATGGSPAGISNGTRGIFAGGIAPGATTNMDYVTIASNSNAQDFGDLSTTRDSPFGCASSVRGIVAGGFTPSPGTKHASIDYVTISSTGNALDFGDMTTGTDNASMASNSTRGIFGGGRHSGNTLINVIEFITIASTGNAQDFGDLLQVRGGGRGAASSTRMVFGGGYFPSSPFNNFTNGAIEFVEIATTGNGQGFGDLTVNREQAAGCSNGHGGL
tara:strand:- start:8 stop:1183 length:1176 start_codon:yes stop_codon:yes gene_type:complete